MKKKFEKESNNFSQTISFQDNSILALIYGEHDKFLKLFEEELKVSIITRGNFIKLSGEEGDVSLTKKIFEKLYQQAEKNNSLDEGEVLGIINLSITK